MSNKGGRVSPDYLADIAPEYARYPNIPKTLNSIEPFFGHLKDHLQLSRRLSESHFNDFVKWYLFLQSNDGKVAK